MYRAQYKYDALGNSVYSNVKKRDGSKLTKNKVYNGELPVSESTYDYDACLKSETTDVIEYGDEGYPVHQVRKAKHEDGPSRETWLRLQAARRFWKPVRHMIEMV